jgi:hypothetical protein
MKRTPLSTVFVQKRHLSVFFQHDVVRTVPLLTRIQAGMTLPLTSRHEQTGNILPETGKMLPIFPVFLLGGAR